MKDLLLKIAARCEVISRRTEDLTTARELREFAEDIRQMAEKLPAPDPASRAPGS
jgi:hypothetical protein